MRRVVLCITAMVFFAPHPVHSQQPGNDKDKDAEIWLVRAMGKVALCKTVEWDASMEVVKVPVNLKRKYPIRKGFTDYQFRVKGCDSAEKDFVQAVTNLQNVGDAKIYWEERVRGQGDSPNRQVWGDGNVFLLRSSRSPDKLARIKVFQGDGLKDGVLLRFLGGGVIGWRLGSGIDETSQAPYGTILSAGSPKWVKEEALGGRKAVVLDATVYAVACQHHAVGTVRIWIDCETHLMIQRRSVLHDDMGEQETIVNEIYSNWKLNQPIADENFQPPSK